MSNIDSKIINNSISWNIAEGSWIKLSDDCLPYDILSYSRFNYYFFHSQIHLKVRSWKINAKFFTEINEEIWIKIFFSISQFLRKTWYYKNLKSCAKSDGILVKWTETTIRKNIWLVSINLCKSTFLTLLYIVA